MPQVFIASAEGEHALFQNTLITLGNDDNKHRGSVGIVDAQSMFREWTAAQTSDDVWVHVLMARNDGNSNSGDPFNFLNIYTADGDFIAGLRDADQDFDDDLAIRTRWASSASSGNDSQGTFIYFFNNQEFINIDIRLRRTTVTNPNDTMTIDFYFEQQLRETRVNTDAGGWEQPRELLLTALHEQINRDGCAYQDIIISDGIPTVGMELVTMAPAALGFYSQFTNNYTNIDELGYDSNDLIFATTAGQRESFVMVTPTFDTSDKIIYAFVLSYVAQTDLGNVVSDFEPFLRIASINYAGQLALANNVAPDNYMSIWTQNPNTLAPWVQSDFDGLQAGFLTT